LGKRRRNALFLKSDGTFQGSFKGIANWTQKCDSATARAYIPQGERFGHKEAVHTFAPSANLHENHPHAVGTGHEQK
jgi:hypothetical protein